MAQDRVLGCVGENYRIKKENSEVAKGRDG